MKRLQRSKRTREKTGSWFYLFVVFILLIVSTGGSYLYFKPRFAFESSFIEDIESERLKAGDEEKKEDTLKLYKSYEYTPSTWQSEEFRKDAFLVIAEDVITKYLKPYKVDLLDLYMDRKGLIYVDLSAGLKKDFKGDVFEEFSFVAGLYSRIKTTIPGFTALKILIEGREVETFGGHIDISKPIGGEIAGGIR